jgi:hypothetical protein
METQLACRAKSLVPSRARAALRSAHQSLVFNRAMRRFLKDPGAHVRPGSPTLRDLVYGWGNMGWSARDEYLAACLARVQSAAGPVLECGSGLSTLLAGIVASRRGVPYWALEHDAGWAEKVRASLRAHRVARVVLDRAPLRDYGEYSWYDPPLGAMPERFSLVICDGPPGATKGGRAGFLPVMRSRLAPGCRILLDDAARERERAIARRWSEELGAKVMLRGSAKPFIELRLP